MLSKILISITVIVFLIRFKKIFIGEFIKLKFHFKMYSYYFLLSLTTFIISPWIVFRPKQPSNGLITSSLMKHITKLYRIEWHVRNGEILAEDRGAVIISNHQSVFDISGLNNVWHVVRNMVPIAKKEILYTGPLGLATYLCGSILIDRKNPKQAYKAMESATSIMTKDKTKIWVFPEGTRNTKWNGKLLPFKKGAFNIAVTAQVPIIPVVYSPYYFIDKGRYIFDKGHVIMQCLEPVSTVGLTTDDVPALADRLHLIMSSTYKQLAEEVRPDTRRE